MAAPRQLQTKEVTCEDFLGFQEVLKKMRLIDDRIIYKINTMLPTDSFANKVDAVAQCEQIHKELSGSYREREKIIKKCITIVSNNVNQLKEEKMKDESSMDALKNLRKEQNKLRLMQSELNIEEVLRDKSFRTFDEKCRRVFTLPKIDV